MRFAAHLVAPGVSVQANMSERASVLAEILAAFRGAQGDLAASLLAVSDDDRASLPVLHGRIPRDEHRSACA